MTNEPESEQKNFIEAKLIIQEFHDDTNVFVVGTAPFGRVWFDREKVDQQYKVLTDSWYQEYGDNETKHSKKPRVINILIDEADPMFNKYREANCKSQSQPDDSSAEVTDATKKSEYIKGDTISQEKTCADSATSDLCSPPAEKKKASRGKKKKEVNEVVVDTKKPVEPAEIPKQTNSATKPRARKKKTLVVEDATTNQT